MDTFWGTVIGLLGAAATIGSVIVLLLKSRSEGRSALANAKNALDERIDARVKDQLTTAWAEIDSLKSDLETVKAANVRKNHAMANILKSLAKQWPGPNAPELDPNDLAEVEDSVPNQWIVKYTVPKKPITGENKTVPKSD